MPEEKDNVLDDIQDKFVQGSARIGASFTEDTALLIQKFNETYDPNEMGPAVFSAFKQLGMRIASQADELLAAIEPDLKHSDFLRGLVIAKALVIFDMSNDPDPEKTRSEPQTRKVED